MDQVAALLSGEQPWALLHGDCVEELRAVPDCSVDSVVTDPPAGVSFMGKSWDDDLGGRTEWVAWLAGVMRECLRVLKPGGHALVWALPRTSHWTGTALEDAGFAVRDVVTTITGQGFPKSMDISKQLDARAGETREVVGKYQPPSGQDWKLKQAADASVEAAPGTFTASGRRTLDITAPATDDAKKWAGWGTALKPAVEFWFLVRKPLSEKTVAQNVLRHGTGGINIDACRIQAPGEVIINKGRGAESAESKGVFGDSKATDDNQTSGQRLGRFPANLVLEHSAECEKVGTRKVKAITGTKSGSWRTGGQYSGGYTGAPLDELGAPVGYAGADGMEDVENWNCAPGCPVPVLDAQSGASGAFAPVPAGHQKDSKGVYGDFAALAESSQDRGTFYGDAGGASRFFFQASWRTTVGNDPLFRYEAKAATSERWIWCRVCKDAFSSDDAHVLHGRQCDECRVDYPRAENLGQMMVGSRAQVDGTGWRPKDAHQEHKTTTNIIQHPTQKSEDLMTWLVKLVTPPGGIVCDPFTGSGTTGVAALRGGFRFLGVEREPDYQRIAEKRIDYAKQMGHQPDLFGGGAA